MKMPSAIYENAFEFNSESVYAHYLTGVVYHTLGVDDKDVDILEKAQENYQKTLELDPDHKEANKQLNKLSEIIGKHGIKTIVIDHVCPSTACGL